MSPAPGETTVASTILIQFTTPEQIAGFSDVVVINPDGQAAVLPQSFFFTPPPAVFKVTPDSGTTLGGETVTVTGQGFQPGLEAVFGSTKATDVNVLGADQFTCTTPPGTPGPAAVTVTNPDLSNHTLGGGFLYIAPPKIVNIFPTLGPETGGTKVTIQGKDFVLGDEGTKVLLGGVEVVDVTIDSPTLITLTTPPGNGPVAVKVLNPDGQFDVVGGGFIYIPVVPPPEITSITPSFGPTAGGYNANVVGKNFLAGAKVAFGTDDTGWTEGLDIKVKNAGTLLVVTIPTHPAQVVDVRVTNSDGQFDVLEAGFQYTGPLQLPALAFGAVSPNRGPNTGGYDVLVYGQGFKFDVKVFWGQELAGEWVDSQKVVRLGPTLLKVTMPDYPTSEIVDIRISNPAYGGLKDEVVGLDAFTFGQAVVLQPKGHRLPIDLVKDDRHAVIFDANGDGMNDVLITHGTDRDELYINTKDENGVPGLFVDVSATNLPAVDKNHWRWQPKAVDYDYDGDLDVLVVQYHNLGTYVNQGDGTFTYTAQHVGVNLGSLYDMDVGDLDCDGLKDLFLTFDGKNYVATGNDKGRFTVRHVMPEHSEPSRSSALADVDLDGDLDVMVANDNAFQNRLYYNNCNNVPMPPTCAHEMTSCKTNVFEGHRYAFCAQSWNWWDARNKCNHYGWELASVNNKLEQDFIAANNTYHTWIGYNDQAEEGKWVNFGGADWSQWHGGQPNTESYDCAMMNVSWGYNWDDQNCAHGYHFACEYDGPDACPTPWSFTDATYGTNKNFPVSGFNSVGALIDDLNQDGWPDAIIINNGQTNRIYFNNGGNFQNDDGLHYPQDDQGKDRFGQLVDIDKDGDLDLVLAKDQGSGHLWPSVYVNDIAQGGPGIFTNKTEENLPAWRGEYVYSMVIGDLNDDGLEDMYLVIDDHQDWMLWNNGYKENVPMTEENRVPIGSFTNSTFFGVPEEPWGTRCVDVDGDGDLDVIMGNAKGQRTRLWLNDGAGNFFDYTEERLPDTKCESQDIRFVDLNNDGDLDVIEICYDHKNQEGGVRQLVNNGAGTFLDVTKTNFPMFTYGHGRYHGLGIGDLDGDGDLDVLIGGYNYTFFSLVNGGDVFGTDGAYFLTTSKWFPGIYQSWIVDFVVTDLNNDTYPDVYIARSGAQNSLWYNTGKDGVMKNVSTTHLPSISDTTRWVEANDVDTDGDVDLYVFNSGQNRLHVGELDFKYSDVTVSHLPPGMSGDTYGGTIGDLDRDGLIDFMMANWNQQNQLILNQGDAHFGDFTISLPRDYDYSHDIHLGDFDGDGVLDVFMANYGASRIYLNKTPEPNK